MHSVWAFLVQNGAVKTVMNFFIVFLLGALVKYVRSLIKHQKKTNDLLDPTTPGGLGDSTIARKPLPKAPPAYPDEAHG